jgi:hypothetical protein
MLLQKSSALIIHHSDTSLANYMVAMHLEAQFQWVMRKSDSGSTTQCFMSHGDASGYASALLIAIFEFWSFNDVLSLFDFILIARKWIWCELLAIWHVAETQQLTICFFLNDYELIPFLVRVLIGKNRYQFWVVVEWINNEMICRKSWICPGYWRADSLV